MTPSRKRSPRPRDADESAQDQARAPRQWVFFRNDHEGRVIAREEFNDLPAVERAGLHTRMERYAAGESRRQDVAFVGDGIFEIRHRAGNNQYRVLFIMWGRFLVALTAFYKNQRAIEQKDINRAKQRKTRWIELFGKTPPSD